MKPIKFRAWDKEFKKFSAIGLKTMACDIEFADDYEWCQYTGIKDRNGIEVYEGDIVKYEYTEDDYGVVEWDDEDLEWVISDSECGVCFALGTFYSHELEVIDNIHENKLAIRES